VHSAVTILVGAHIYNVPERIALHFLHTIERDRPDLQFLEGLIENDGLNVACEEERQREKEKEHHNEVLPPESKRIKKSGVYPYFGPL
jgi:uncharacterized protein YaeQ